MAAGGRAGAALEGLVVVELASVLAGPSVGQFLAELGADVLKVENPATGGDVTRRWKLPTEPTAGDLSAYFACCNWGKRSVGLDLRTPAGRALLHRLAGRADVVLASYRPGTAAALGADAATLRAVNARLIYAAVSGYGPDDPRAGYDAVIQAESGFLLLNGPAEGEPVKMPVALVDLLAAHQLKEGILLALLHRERTGEGGEVHVSLLQAAVSALANQATNYLVGGVVPRRMGSAHPNIAPYGTLFPTRDGRPVLLAVGTDEQFRALCDVLGLDALAADPRFRTNPDRVRHRDALGAVLAGATRGWEREALLAALEARSVPVGAVRDLKEVFDTDAARALVLGAEPRAGLRQAAFRPAAHGVRLPELPPPPRFAQHTDAVLADVLGLDATERDRLAEGGVIARGEGVTG